MAKIKRNNRVRILSSKTMYKGRVFSVRRDKIVEPGNIHVTRDIVVHSGSVVVLPILEDGRVLLIRQYRHAVGENLWELVAGRREPAESATAAARRELKEETGYTARRIRRILDVIPTPGFVSERMRVFVAQGLAKGTAYPEEDERIAVRAFTWRQMDGMIRKGRLLDAKSIAGLLFYMRYIRRSR
jgi:8-oxo-dGTP pyrophosphatase MutT (NUDIX family)